MLTENPMGQQVNFYLSDNDQKNLLNQLSEYYGLSAILPPLRNFPAEPKQPDFYSKWEPGQHDPILFRTDDIGQLIFRYVGGVANAYFIDSQRSPVIELWRSTTSGDIISRGRLYFIPSYYDDKDRLVQKPEAFVRTAKAMLVFTRRFCPSKIDFFYVGPEATALQKQGWKLGG